MTPQIDPAWLAALRAQANRPPVRPRLPLWAAQGGAGGVQIGTVEPGFVEKLVVSASLNIDSLLQKREQNRVLGWALRGEVSPSLNTLAQAMRTLGLAGAWRNEQLAVCGPLGERLGTIERAAVRPLGIATQAVHLVGLAPDGCFWVQQRALDKANDPGLWDTLMGGMVGADDGLAGALARETWEEAGLQLAQLQQLHHGGQVRLSGPSRDGAGMGYVTERIDWYQALLPQGVRPVNQDGEVAQFRCVTRDELVGMLQAQLFTTEAAGILCEALGVGSGFAYDADSDTPR